MFVKDDSGGLLIYDYSSPVITTQYNEGDLIERIQGNLLIYQGTFEFLPTKNSPLSMYSFGEVEPIPTSINNIKNDYKQYETQLVTLDDVLFTVEEQPNGSLKWFAVQNEEKMQIYNRFNSLSLTIPNNTRVNVTGFVYFYTDYGYQIFPRSNNDIEII